MDKEFQKVEAKESDFRDNYESGQFCLTRFLFLTQALDMLLATRSRVKEIEEAPPEKQETLEPEDIPNIKYEDSAIYVGRQLAEELEAIKREKNSEEIEVIDICGAIYKSSKGLVWLCTFLFIGESLCKMGFSIILQYLFEAVAEGEKSRAYILAASAGFTWFCSQVARHNAFYLSPIIGGRVRAGLIYLLFAKLSSMSQFVVKSNEIGKVTNMLSNDFNLIELKIPIFFAMLNFPVSFVGISAILITRLGWPGVVGILVPVVVFPIQAYVSKKNGQLLQQVNVNKDARVKICTEIIEGIKFVKLYGWELAFKNMIQKFREREINDYIWLSIGRCIQRAISNAVAIWAALLTFITIEYTIGGLTTALIFSTLQLMVFLRLQIFFFGIGVGFLFELQVIFNRFTSVLNIENVQMVQIDSISKKPLLQHSNANLNESQHQLADETEMMQIHINSSKKRPQSLSGNVSTENLHPGELIFENFSGYWTLEELTTPSLLGINVKFEKGNFYGICGKIGSGKSGLLGAILGEIPYYSGTLNKSGSMVYVEQEPVIFSTTLRENILFGKPMHKSRYEEAIHNSCLESDLELLENGDETLVGERGITLSGGQKARLALARALFADADIYLLDDPISAVDSKVAKEIHEKVILSLSKTKTLILVTHQINYLSECDHVLIMDEGQIVRQGSPGTLKRELEELSLSEKKEEQPDPEQEKLRQEIEEENRQFQLEVLRKRKSSMMVSEPSVSESALPKDKKINAISKEENVKVTMSTYVDFVTLAGVNKVLFPLTIVFFILAEIINTFYMRFLAEYSNQKEGRYDLFGFDIDLYWGVLAAMSLAYFLTLVVKYSLLSLVVLWSNERLHFEMMHGLVRCPSGYFDTTPTGRLVNKFSNDLGILDNTLAFTFTDTLEGPIISIIMLINIFQINLFFIPPGAVNVAFLVFFFTYCKATIVESKQLDLRAKSPVFNIFAEMVSGLVQIRIFHRRPTLLNEFSKVINNMTRANYSYWICSRGFGTYVSYFSIVILTVGYVLGVYNATPETAGLYGISVVFLVQINDYLQWFLRQIIVMESIMVSVERSKNIVHETPEKPLRTQYDCGIGFQQEIEEEERLLTKDLKGVQQQKHELSWPEKAEIEFKHLSMRYREELPLVLKNVSFKIEHGEKVGIVGRTGAGKSSIIQAIFRIVEPEPGSEYYLGGYDATEMGLHSLRQHISVIPQTPFIFRGSVRENIDPFSLRTQSELWEALAESGLRATVEELQEKLETDISNTSQVFSVGQKQLLCLARALLRRNNKILVLDEATSNVDMKTDELIQNVLKSKFKASTVITIAHRLNTIADYDKIIVMHRGRVVEVGSPFELIRRKGAFAEMVEHTGTNADNIRRIARNKHESRR